MLTKAILRTVGATAILALSFGAAQASDGVIRIGVLNDQSGLYADVTGQGSVIAARMAAEKFGGRIKGQPIEILFADHQNKPDIGTQVGRQWIDRDKVDVIVDVPTSSVALAINQLTREKNKVFIGSGPATSDLTGAQCSPNTVHWTYDTWSLANGTGKAVVQSGGDTWYFLTADYAFGHALERDTSAVVTAAGGKVLGSIRHPLAANDFSSFLLQAQGSKAKIIGVANAGGDTINTIKQAAEFGIARGGQKLAGLLMFISDVHSLGLRTAAGLQLTSAFYWDRDEGSRAFAKEFSARHKGAQPTMVHAGVYAGLLHYFKAIEALGGDVEDGKAAVAKMKELPTDDPLFGKGVVRADGRKIHDMYLFEVKQPSESKGPWDYYKLVRTIPAAEAFRPLDQGGCSLVK